MCTAATYENALFSKLAQTLADRQTSFVIVDAPLRRAAAVLSCSAVARVRPRPLPGPRRPAAAATHSRPPPPFTHAHNGARPPRQRDVRVADAILCTVLCSVRQRHDNVPVVYIWSDPVGGSVEAADLGCGIASNPHGPGGPA